VPLLRKSEVVFRQRNVYFSLQCKSEYLRRFRPSEQIFLSLLRRGLLQSRLGKKYTRSAQRLGRGKNKSARGTLGRGKKKPFPSSHRSPRTCFLSPALPLPFLSLVFTNRSLCGGERIFLETNCWVLLIYVPVLWGMRKQVSLAS